MLRTIQLYARRILIVAAVAAGLALLGPEEIGPGLAAWGAFIGLCVVLLLPARPLWRKRRASQPTKRRTSTRHRKAA